MRPNALAGALAALALTTADAAAQTATQFDLVCSGTRQSGVDAAPEPHDYRIRVDLDARRWCWDSCERTFEIAEVAPDRIVFESQTTDTLRKRSMSENTVSRQTGEHRMIWIESRPFPTYMETKGSCEAATFTAFPAARF